MGSIEEEQGIEGTLYFAYGSNLSPTQMHSRCPLSTPIGLAHLPGWKWIINKRGYANIVQYQTPSPTPASTITDQINSSSGEESGNAIEAVATEQEGVYGVLYRLHPNDEATLDRCEGVPWAYERQFLDVTVVQGPRFTKIAIDEGRETLPLQDSEKMKTARVLVYIDFQRDLPGIPNTEYVDRMNRGIEEAMTDWELPKPYVNAVMRPFIPS
ncbi:hypothetical protein GGS26DRAFT_591533 [Hypomontagnella submonticulosa]|nr:hypothetical protein GGS26DRAFT_591533 [Hypomontagnella submonticulosa]